MQSADAHKFVEMPAAVRLEASSLIIEYVDTFNSRVQELFATQAKHGSRAAKLALTEESLGGTWLGKFPVRGAVQSILFATLAGMDHVRTFGIVLGSESPTFSTATITRGAIECYGRANWLLHSKDAQLLVTRWLSGIAKELSMMVSINPDADLLEMSGRGAPADEVLTQIIEDIARISPDGKPTPFSFTGLAVAMEDKITPAGRAMYSHLSAVAHGEFLGANGFFGMTASSSAGELFNLRTPDHWALGYSEQVFNATSSIMRDLNDFYGRAHDEHKDSALAHDRLREFLINEHIRVFGTSTVR